MSGGTMSEQQVLPELIATLKAAAEKAEIGEWQVVRGKGGEGWTICSLGDDRDGNPVSIETMGVRGSQLRCSILNDAEFFVAASPENILKLLASLAQSEGCRMSNCKDCQELRESLAREREANQGLREVVKEYSEDDRDHLKTCRTNVYYPGLGLMDDRCPLCIKADALLEPKSKPVATTEEK